MDILVEQISWNFHWCLRAIFWHRMKFHFHLDFWEMHWLDTNQARIQKVILVKEKLVFERFCLLVFVGKNMEYHNEIWLSQVERWLKLLPLETPLRQCFGNDRREGSFSCDNTHHYNSYLLVEMKVATKQTTVEFCAHVFWMLLQCCKTAEPRLFNYFCYLESLIPT